MGTEVDLRGWHDHRPSSPYKDGVKTIGGRASLLTTILGATSLSITADGTTTSTITVRVKDVKEDDLIVGGDDVVLSQSGSATISSVTDNSDGTYTATITNTVAEDVVISSTIDGSSISNTISMSFTVGTASVDTSNISVSSPAVSADGVEDSTITVQLVDDQNNNLTEGGDDVVITQDGSGVIHPANTETATLTWTAPTLNDDGSSLTDLAGYIVYYGTSINNLYLSIEITDPEQVSVDITDLLVNTNYYFAMKAVNSQGVESDLSEVATITIIADVAEEVEEGVNPVIDNGDGTYTARSVDSTTESVVISGTVNDVAIEDTATIDFVTITAADEATTIITTIPLSVTSNGTSASVITVQAKDSSSNNLTAGGDTVTLLENGSATISTVTDNADGTYTATVVDSTTELITISGTINSSAITSTATIDFINPTVGAKYVSKAGNDTTGDGTVGTPWLTIQKGLDTISSGDILYVKEGTYIESVNRSGTPGIHLSQSGTSGDNTVVQAFPGDSVIVDGNGVANGFNAFSKSYFEILDFEIQNTYTSSNDNVGGIFLDGCDNANIEGNHIHHIDGATGTNVGGVRTDDCDLITIHNNKIHDITVGGVNNGNSACIHGYFQQNITVTQNTLYNAHKGVFHKASNGTTWDGYTIENNVIHDVNYGCFYSQQGSSTPAHGKQIVNQNIFYNCSEASIHQRHSNYQNKEMVVTNNVFDVSGAKSGIWIRNTDASTVTSNIFYGSLSKDSQRYEGTNVIDESDYNCYYLGNKWVTDLFGANDTYYSLSSWQASGEEAGSANPDLNAISSNPTFTNAGTRDYHLQVGSPCLSTGKGAINMGCYLTGSEQIGSTV